MLEQSGGKLFVWTSATSGFHANPAHLLVSTTGAFEGPFVEAGNPTHDAASFSSQCEHAQATVITTRFSGVHLGDCL